MTLASALRVLRKNLLWLLVFPLVVTGTVAYLTRDLPRTYTSTATVYTGFASGLSISDAGGDNNNQKISNAFDNLMTTIKARETLSEVGLHLLARHLCLERPSPNQLSSKAFNAIQDLRRNALKQAIVPGNELATLENLKRLAEETESNVVKHLLYQSSTPYAVEGILGRVTVARKNNSDMLELSCKGEDPAVCQQTLVFMIDTFRRRYQAFRSSENGTVVKYFEDQAQTAFQGLKSAEDRLTGYSTEHKLINYGEQSKYTAESKEEATKQYYQEKMQQQAALAALRTLEHKLDERTSVLMANSDVSLKRSELAKMQTKLANALVYQHPEQDIAILQNNVDRLSEDLKVAVRRLYNTTNTIESIPQQQLLDSYVEQTLKMQGSTARMQVLQARVQAYEGVYDKLAPQGSAIHRLEREVGLAEREYLSVLNGLNAARLRQKDLEMTGSMSVLDAPSLPMKPQPSIRSMLVAMSFVAGLVTLLSFLLGKEFMKGTIQTPERAEQVLGMPLAAAFPLVHKRFAHYDISFVEQCMIEQLRSSLLIEGPSTPADVRRSYQLITLWSTRDGQGKTWIGERISHQLVRAGHRVCYLYPETSTRQPDTDAFVVPYPIQTDFADTVEAGVLLQLIDAPVPPVFDYVFLELPGLLVNAIPVHLVAQSQLSLLVVHAQTSWTKADQALSTLFQKASRHKVMSVLNAVEPDRLEPLLGKIPRLKKQSKKAKQTTPSYKPSKHLDIV